MLKISNFTMLAAVAALAVGLAACSSSDSGPSQADLDAANAAAAAAEAKAAAAEQAAADAAAAAAAAAAEAAAQAERDKQAAVEAARQAAIAEQQKMSVMAAVTAAQEAVAALMDDSSDADVAGAMAEIAKATAAIAAATSLSADETTMYGAQVAAVQADLNLAEANIRAYRAEMEAEEAKNQATAADRAKTTVEDAIAALTTAGEAETMAEATYTTAAAALATAQQAVADADSETLADASAALAAALIAASTASADLAVKTQAVADATAALTAARAILAEADPDHVALLAANAALEKATSDRDALTERVAALQKQIDDLIAAQEKADEERRMAEEQRIEEQMKADMAAAGKALHAALGANPLGNIENSPVPITSAGLVIDPQEGPGVADGSIAAVTLEAVEDSDGTLGDWNSMEYAHSDTGTKISNGAMVYTNQADPTMKAFAAGATQADADGGDLTTVTAAPASAWEYNSTSRTLLLPADLAGGTAIAGDMFPTAGTTTYTPSAPATETILRGTYQGASGNYRCATGCGATATAGGGVTLAGTWSFVHDSGAMVSIDDSAYLFFGWWLRKDKDGPTHASAFVGKVGLFLDGNDDDAEDPLVGLNAIVGSATYTGAAAGKFAINDPINGGDAGHFTADATLTAKFSGEGAGVTGTISNFRLNDGSEDAGWSVALNKTTLRDSGGTEATAATTTAELAGFSPGNNMSDAGAIASPTVNYGGNAVNETLTTVWSIDGNAAAASGTWSGQMYDELPGTVADEGDGSNVPTSVTGVFQSKVRLHSHHGRGLRRREVVRTLSGGLRRLRS